MSGVEELIKKLEDDGWRVEMSGTRHVWCYRGCKLPVPPVLGRTVKVYVLVRGDTRVILVAPADG